MRPIVSINFIGLGNIPNKYGFFMEEPTCEATVPHINGNVVKKNLEISVAKDAVHSRLRARLQATDISKSPGCILFVAT